MALPVWVTDEAGSISYMNARAEELFGHTFREWSGRPCHLCVRGRSLDGAVCGPRCHVRREADAGQEIRPIRMQVASTPEEREVNVMMIAIEGAGAHRIVHCVVGDERERRLHRFLDGVMNRNELPASILSPLGAALTAREEEILALLARDMSLRQIAEKLRVSYATVRNHVQHILSKLGVHSILEAAAVWMMRDEERQPRRR